MGSTCSYPATTNASTPASSAHPSARSIRRSVTSTGRPSQSVDAYVPKRTSWYGRWQASTVFFEHRMYVDFNRAPRLVELRVKCSLDSVDDMVAVYQPYESAPLQATGSLTAEQPDVKVLRLAPGEYITRVVGVWAGNLSTKTSLASLQVSVNGGVPIVFGRAIDDAAAMPRGHKRFVISCPPGCVFVGFFGGRRRYVNMSNRAVVGPMHTIGGYIVSRFAYETRQVEVFTAPPTTHQLTAAMLSLTPSPMLALHGSGGGGGGPMTGAGSGGGGGGGTGTSLIPSSARTAASSVTMAG